MDLEETFGKVEKPAEEKKLEVITSKETVVEDLRVYFKNSMPSKWTFAPDDFKAYKNYLQIFRITPEIITKINEKLPKQSPTTNQYLFYQGYKGVFLSALMQTSYN